MITSSAISQSAIDVNLPKASAQDPSVTDPTTVTINADGKYFVKHLEVPKEQLEQNIVKLVEGTPNLLLPLEQMKTPTQRCSLLPWKSPKNINMAI